MEGFLGFLVMRGWISVDIRY